ncbi:MAG: amidohydrolase/deacetylase family metallohydrolase [Chloroflexota bacterium]|nr:amidohydrolase/deacetylase family metallohydrolase [Chloroflexota bacterium]
MKYDIVIEGARVVDPAQNIDRVTNVAVAGGKIAAVGDDLDLADAARRIDARGKFLSPGWIDMHVHTYSHLAFSHPDTIGVLHGVTTVVDAGGAGAWTYDDCRTYWEGRTKTDIYALPLYNAAGIYLGDRGVLDQEPNQSLQVPLDDWLDMVDRNRDRVRMIKSATVTRLGFRPVEAARAIADRVGLPMYMHIGDQRGESGFRDVLRSPGPIITKEVLDTMRPGDCVTHTYTGNRGGLLGEDGEVLPELYAARKRGVWLDVGYGGLNFDWDVFDKLLAADVITDAIDTDLQGVNVTGPVHSLAHVMSIFLNHGLTIPELVERVTINPARILRLEDKMGSLTPGYPARATVFEVEDGDYTFRDHKGVKRAGNRMIKPAFCVMDGEVIEADFEPSLEQSNWSFMPLMADDDLSVLEGRLDDEQREFAHALGRDYAEIAWDEGHDLHKTFKRRVTAMGIDEVHAVDGVFDLFMENRFLVPVGWLLKTFDKETAVERLLTA